MNKGEGGLIVLTTTYTAVTRGTLIPIVKTAEDNNNGFHAVFPNSLYARNGGARWYYGPKDTRCIIPLERSPGHHSTMETHPLTSTI